MDVLDVYLYYLYYVLPINDVIGGRFAWIYTYNSPAGINISYD